MNATSRPTDNPERKDRMFPPMKPRSRPKTFLVFLRSLANRPDYPL